MTGGSVCGDRRAYVAGALKLDGCVRRLVTGPEQTAAERMLDRWTSLLDNRYTRRNATVTAWRAV
jgi:hypothetical protein